MGSNRFLQSTLAGMVFAFALHGALRATAQQIDVPQQGAPAAAGKAVPQVFDAAHLKDRPYSGALPAPAFPSTPRTQRSFTVSYVYDYAFSSYTPAADLPTVVRGQAKRDTPEDAAIAFFSAQRAGDFDGFLQCWTEKDRKRIQELTKTPGMDRATALARWKQLYTGKVQLVDRIETTGYVILDVRVGTAQMPAVFKLVEGQWLATNDLGENGNQMLSSYRPGLAGIVVHAQPTPASELGLGRGKEAAAQKDFLDAHSSRSDVVRSGQ